MDVSTRRIVFLGKTGAGKSSLANTLCGETAFKIDHSPTSGTSKCQSKYMSINGREVIFIDTPGFFDTGRSEEEMKPEIVRCITECAPGPHVFLIVLKVEKFTQQEQDVINKIWQYFSEDAMKYAAVVFTHGDQLPEGMKVEEFVSKNNELKNLVEKCGGRCHVVDNKYWKNNKENDYRSNQFQVAEILRTIDKMTETNNRSCYTNEMLQKIESEMQVEEEHIRQSSANMSQAEIKDKAKTLLVNKLLTIFAGTATGVLVGAFLGVAKMVTSAVMNIQAHSGVKEQDSTTSGRAALALAAQNGLLQGGWLGYAAAEGAGSPQEAMRKAAKAVLEHTAK